MDDSHLYMFLKTNSSNNVCVQTQNIVKYLYKILFSWGINDEQRSTVNGLHKTLSNICVKFYSPNEGINVEQHSTVNGFALHLCNLRFGYLFVCTNTYCGILVWLRNKEKIIEIMCVCMWVNIYFFPCLK